VIAVVLCTFNNVDTVSLVGHLSTDPQMRAAAATEAVGFLNATGPSQKTPAPAPSELPNSTGDMSQRTQMYKLAIDATTLPLWWTKSEWTKLLYTVGDIEAKTAIGHEKKQAGNPPASDFAKPVSRFGPNYTWLLAKFTGLLISIMAVSMGAPFWFDVLNKLVNVRLVGQRPEKSAAETPVAPAAGTA
jgi:hypothetical protein